MWKLTISQARKFTFSDETYTEKIEFTSNDINDLATLIVRLSKYENGVETTYKLE